jgi:hypothetical protein
MWWICLINMLEMCDEKFNDIIIDINIQQCTFLTLHAKVKCTR